MSWRKLKRFLAGALCTALLIGNNGSAIAYAAALPENVQGEEETEQETLTENQEKSETEEISEEQGSDEEIIDQTDSSDTEDKTDAPEKPEEDGWEKAAADDAEAAETKGGEVSGELVTMEAELEGVYQFGDTPADIIPEDNGASTFALEDTSALEEYLYEQMLVRMEEIDVSGYGVAREQMGGILSGILNEHADLYFVNRTYRWSYNATTGNVVRVAMSYDNTLDDAAFHREAAAAMAVIEPGMSDLNKAIALHEYLTINCEYDYENYLAGTIPRTSYSAYGTLVNHIAVCQGYAVTYKYLLNQAGIECCMVSSDLLNHAWNLIRLDGEWYQVDVTWDDPTWDQVGRSGHTYMFRSDNAFGHLDKSTNAKDWKVTVRADVVDYTATDTRYDEAFWTACNSPLVMADGNYYYTAYDNGAKLKKRAMDGSEEGIVCDIGIWPAWGSDAYWPYAYSGLFLNDNRLYYNDNQSIYSIALDGTDRKTEFTADTKNGYIYRSALRWGKVYYSLRQSPNLSAKEEVLEADIIITPAAIPVEKIELSEYALTLEEGGEALLSAVVVPENATDREIVWMSSNETVATVKDGTVTAVTAGSCTVTASAGGESASCSVIVERKIDETPDVIASGIVDEEYGQITWVIDANGKLTVEGTGDYAASGYWRAPWYSKADAIISAEIKVTGMTDASYMFSGCNNLCSVDVSGFDTGQVIDMSRMFCGCSSLKELDLSNFDTSQVTNMGSMFSECSSLTRLDLSNFDTGQVTDVRGMFGDCTELIDLDLSGMDFTQEPDPHEMFRGCTKLSCIKTPINVKETIDLPMGTESAWYQEDGTEIKTLPQNLSHSIQIRRSKMSEENPDSDFCTVSFDLQGHGNLPDITVVSGNKIERPMDLTDDGYVFTGWYKDASCTEVWDFASDVVTGNMTLYAGWEQKSVSAVADPTASIPSGTEVEAGTRVSLTTSTNGAQIYYTLDGTDPTAKSNLYDDAIIIAGDVTIHAIAMKTDWENSNIVSFTYSVKDVSADWGDLTEEDQRIYRNPSEIPNGLWVAGIPEEVDYTGKKITFSDIRVYDHKVLLTDKTDYTISYKNNQNVAWTTGAGSEPYAKAAVTIKGRGNYSGSIVKYFRINPLAISSEDVSAAEILKAWNGKSQKAVPVLYWNGKALKKGTDFIVSYNAVPEGSGTPYVSEGTWEITVTGKGNFIGERSVMETITTKTLMSKVRVASIPNQNYTGNEVELTEKDLRLTYGGKTLGPDDYTVEYVGDHTEVGTVKVLFTGKEESGYAGSVTKTFRIIGTVLSERNVKIDGFQKSFIYTGEAVRQQGAELVSRADNNILEENKDYTVTYRNNVKTGTATVLYQGMGSYTGTIKKTYRIMAYNLDGSLDEDEGRISVDYAKEAFYEKGGAKPVPTVTYTYGGKSVVLVPGIDYKVSYQNNRAVTESIAGDAANPALYIEGKGNFSGKLRAGEFSIRKKSLADDGITISVPDVRYQKKANIYKASPVLTDANGKKLKPGVDYEKAVYTYEEETVVIQTANKKEQVVLRRKGDTVDPRDIIPVGTVIRVTVTGKKNYEGSTSATFRCVTENLSRAAISVSSQYYTGRAVEPGKDQIKVKIGKTILEKTDYEIVSYTNNVKKGTAKVTLRGIGDYGGTKTVTFRILDRTMGYTVIFDGNGATGGNMNAQVIASSEGKSLTRNRYTREGYRFLGWSTDKDAGTGEVMYKDGAAFPGMGSGYVYGDKITLYAQWELIE